MYGTFEIHYKGIKYIQKLASLISNIKQVKTYYQRLNLKKNLHQSSCVRW